MSIDFVDEATILFRYVLSTSCLPMCSGSQIIIGILGQDCMDMFMCMYDDGKTRKRHDSFPRSPDGRRAILAFFLLTLSKRRVS
jgi:hypothetical protein